MGFSASGVPVVSVVGGLGFARSHDRGVAEGGVILVISWRPVSGCSRKRAGNSVRGCGSEMMVKLEESFGSRKTRGEVMAVGRSEVGGLDVGQSVETILPFLWFCVDVE